MSQQRVDLDLTRQEFALQARAMAQGATFQAAGAIEPFLRLLGSPLPSPLLDLACGPGIVTAALAGAGARVVGFDATSEMLEQAGRLCRERHLQADFRLGDAGHLPFEDGSFAGAATRLSVHHFPEPGRVLGELRRVLRRGAPLVVGDIVASSDPPEARLHNALETLRDPSHCRLLAESELVAVIEKAGFRIQTTENWANPKTFEEWAAVVADARSIEPLREVMRALAQAGIRAGFDLRVEEEQVVFTHH